MIKISKIFLLLPVLTGLYNSIIAQEPRLVIPVGHADYIYNVVFSPDNRLIASVSGDNTVKIWMSSDGTLLQTLTGHKSSISDVQFSVNGKYVSTYSYTDTSARVWDISTGKVILNEGPRDLFLPSRLFFNSSGTYVARLIKGDIDLLPLQDIDKAIPLVRQANKPLRIPFDIAAFSPDDKYMVAGCSFIRDSIYSFDLKTRALHRGFKNHGTGPKRISFSPDSKYIAVYNEDSLAIIDFATGQDMYITKTNPWQTDPSFSIDGKFLFSLVYDSSGSMIYKRVDLRTGRESNTSYPLQTRKFFRGTVSADGNQLRALTDNGIYLVNVNNKIENRIFIPLPWEVYFIRREFGDPYKAAFSTDGKRVALFSFVNDAAVYDQKGSSQFNLRGNIAFDSLLLYEKNRSFVYAVQDPQFTENLVSGDLGASVENIRRSKKEYNPNKAQVLIMFKDSLSNRWYIKYRDTKIEFENANGAITNSAWLSPGGKYIVTLPFKDSAAVVWSSSTGKQLYTFRSEYEFKNNRAFFNEDGTEVVISEVKKRNTENFGAYRDLDYRIYVAALETGKIKFEISGRAADYFYNYPKGEFIDSSKYFLTITSNFTIYDTRNWKKIFETPNKSSLYWGNASCNNKNKVLLCYGSSVSLYEAYTNNLLFSLPGEFRYARFSDDDRYILTQSPDNLIKLWNTESGELVYTYFAFEENNYLVIDKYGRYDGTESARKKLYYVCNNEIIRLDQFKALCWEPGLAGKIAGLNTQPVTAKKLSDINICEATPIIEDNGSSAGSFHFNITPRSGGIGEILVFIRIDENAKLIRKYQPSSLKKNGNDYLLSISREEIRNYLVAGAQNELSIKASTEDGNLFSGETLAAIPAEKKGVSNPDVFIVSVGISEYKGDKLRLSYASKDARDLSSAMTLSAKKLLNTDGREHVTTYTFNTEAGSQSWPTKPAIAKALETIATNATADDILVIFFAGHGVLQTGKKSLYLLTSEAAAFDLTGVEKEVSISFDELQSWMQKIKANKQLVILDACNSGEAVKNLQELFTKREVPADQVRALEDLKDKTGTFILSASASGQAAYETSLYGQGLLTYSLLSGIKLGSGLRENKFIDVSKWFNAAADNVKVIAKEIGGRQDPQIIGNASFNVGLVDREVSDAIRLSIKKKVFKRSNFVMEGPMPSDYLLGLSALVDKSLNEVSVRGKESPLTFIADNTLAESYYIVGSYKATGNDVKVKVYLLKSTEEDKPLYEFEQAGSLDKKEKLAADIVEAIQKFLDN